MTLGTVPYGNGKSWDPYDDYQNDYGYGDTYGNVMSDREFLLSYKC